MTAYWITFIIMLFLQVLPVKTNKEYLWKLIITFIPLFIFGAFRVDFGYDYPVYEAFYDEIKRYGLKSVADGRIESGYAYLNSIMPSFRWLIIATTALVCTAYITLFYKYVPQKYVWLVLVLLFLSGDKTIFFMFSGIRNSITVSLLLLSLPLIERKQYIIFALLMLLASTFHKTAFLYYPLAILLSSNKPFRSTEMWLWFFVFVVISIFSHTIIIDHLEVFVNMYFDRYDTYFQTAQELGANKGVLAIVANIIMMTFLLLYMTKNNLSLTENVIFRLGLIFVLSYTMGSLNMRTSQTFVLFYILTLVNIWANCKNKIFKYFYVGFAIAFFAYAFFVVYLGSPTFPYNEYNSVLFE